MIYSCVSKVIQYIVGKFENRINMMAKIKIVTREGIYRLMGLQMGLGN